MNSFIVLMLHEVPEAEVQDWVLQLQKKSLSFITEQLPQKVKMSKSNLQSLFRSCRKIVRNSAGKHRKLLWGNEKKARLLLVHLQYQKQACFFSLSGRKNDVNSYPTNQETPSPLIYLHPDFTDSISLHTATLIDNQENSLLSTPCVAERSDSISNEILSRMGARLPIVIKE